MENPRNVITNYLEMLRTRSRLQTIFQAVTQTIFFGLCFLVGPYIGTRFMPLPFSMASVTFFVIIVVVVVGFYLSFRHRSTLFDIAGYVDEHLELKERVSTSLELIQENRQDEIAQLQILDSAKGVANTDGTAIIPYTLPRFLKWIPIPFLIICFSFTVPCQYELPQPPTVAEREAIDKAIENLSENLGNTQNPLVQDKIRKTIKQLNNIKDVTTAQKHLQTLNSEIQQQKSNFPDEAAIAHAVQATQHFKGMNSSTLTDELERLAEQAKLTPELRDELAKLFANLAKNVPQGDLSRALDQVQDKAVSPDALQEIVNALQKLNQLNQLEAQLTENRKDIALAGIETDQPTRGVANSDGAPGRESGNQETQGAQTTDATSDFTPSGNGTTPAVDKNTAEKPPTGDEVPSLEIAGNALTLNSETTSDMQSMTRVFTGKAGNAGTEPDYLPFNDVVLNAERDYAQAIEGNRIPARHRSQIKAYLEAIAEFNEK